MFIKLFTLTVSWAIASRITFTTFIHDFRFHLTNTTNALEDLFLLVASCLRWATSISFLNLYGDRQTFCDHQIYKQNNEYILISLLCSSGISEKYCEGEFVLNGKHDRDSQLVLFLKSQNRTQRADSNVQTEFFWVQWEEDCLGFHQFEFYLLSNPFYVVQVFHYVCCYWLLLQKLIEDDRQKCLHFKARGGDYYKYYYFVYQ